MQATCTRCRKVVDVDGVVGDDFQCLTCAVVTSRPALPDSVHAKTPIWPWLVGTGVMIAGFVAYLLYVRHERAREELEARFPFVAAEPQQVLLERTAKTWRTGKSALLATVATFRPPVTAGTGTCSVSLAVPKEARVGAPLIVESFREMITTARVPDPEQLVAPFITLDDNLRARVEAHVNALLAGAERGRFRSADAHDHVVYAIGLPLIVIETEVDLQPELVQEDGGRDSFVPGHRIGTAYIFDPATGALRCTSRFEAESSESLSVKTNMITGNALEVLARDFAEQTLQSIRASARSVD